ncbi:MAG: hypothetical protein AB3A66_13050 [Nodularia sp. CChRGM 3473]
MSVVIHSVAHSFILDNFHVAFLVVGQSVCQSSSEQATPLLQEYHQFALT